MYNDIPVSKSNIQGQLDNSSGLCLSGLVLSLGCGVKAQVLMQGSC